MPQFVTENNYTNRKVKYATVASNFVPSILILIGLINTLHPFGITVEGIDETKLNEILIAAGVVLAAAQSAFTWAAGFFAHPSAGDGIKPKE